MRPFEVAGSRVVLREGCYAAMCGRWDPRQHGLVHFAYVELARVEGDMSSILWLGNASVEGTGYDCVFLLKVDGLRSSILHRSSSMAPKSRELLLPTTTLLRLSILWEDPSTYTTHRCVLTEPLKDPSTRPLNR